MRGESEADDAAVAEPHHICARDAESVQDGEGVLFETLIAQRHVAQRGASMPSTVHADDPVIVGEERQEFSEVSGVPHAAVKEQQWRQRLVAGDFDGQGRTCGFKDSCFHSDDCFVDHGHCSYGIPAVAGLLRRRACRRSGGC